MIAVKGWSDEADRYDDDLHADINNEKSESPCSQNVVHNSHRARQDRPFLLHRNWADKTSQLSNIEDCLGNYFKTSTPDHDLYDRHHNHHHNDDHNQYLKKATVSCPKVSLNSTIVAFPAWPIKSSLQANIAKSRKCIFSSRLRVDVRKAHFGSCP